MQVKYKVHHIEFDIRDLDLNRNPFDIDLFCSLPREAELTVGCDLDQPDGRVKPLSTHAAREFIKIMLEKKYGRRVLSFKVTKTKEAETMKDLKKKLNEMMYAPTPMKAEVAEFAYRVICRAMNQAGNVGGETWLDSVVKGHLGPDAKGSVFNGTMASVWDCFAEAHWSLRSVDNGVAIVRGWCDRTIGWLGAEDLHSVPLDLPVKVLSLGDHPTLVPLPGAVATDGVPWRECLNKDTNVLTLVVEYDGEEYRKDCGELKWPDKEPLMAACFPGESLPPSHPHDCAEGDVMTVEAALEKGWKVLKLEWEGDK